jgi:protein involved in polysaccharide export with SLBB domain
MALAIGVLACARAVADPIPPRIEPPPATLPEGAGEGAVQPARYVVGPGDRMRVELWGLYELAQEIDVTAEGRLLVPRVGAFEAGGMTLAALRDAMMKRLHMLYPRLEASLTLVRPRTFLVHVTGAVVHPGTYPASPMTRVSALLPKAGGALPSGSMRRVEIRRRGAAQPVQSDLVRFWQLGEVDRDPLLLDGDTLYVPPRELTVEVSGAVRRPGSYELTGARTLSELLELAGGISTSVAAGGPLRITSRGRGAEVVVRSVDVEADTTGLKDGDRVHVPELAEQQHRVLVEGAVVGPHRPGEEPRQPPEGPIDLRPDAPSRDVSLSLPYVAGDGVRDLLAKAGGLQPWADAHGAYLFHRTPDGKRQQTHLDLIAITTGARPDERIAPGDTLVVPSRREQVLVGGAVQRPGLYPYSGDLRPGDYLSLAGGATRSGNADAARVLSNGVSRPLKRVPAVEPGDVITVPEQKFTAAEWISVSLILGNIVIGAAALGVAAWSAHH